MLIRNLRLLDGTGDLLEGVDVRVRDGRFAEIGVALAGDEPQLDAGGATALPGLIDAHTHLSLDATPEALEHGAERSHGYQAIDSARRARELLAAGVTTARDVGGVAPVILGLRDAIADGLTRGPRIYAAGAWLTAPEGHGWHVGALAEGEDGVRQAARDQLDAGVDLLKLMVSGGVIGTGHGPNTEQFNEREVRVATLMAHAEGKTVAAHAHGEPSIRNAVLGGVDTVEHASFVTAELIGEMLERGTAIVPTLAVIRIVIAAAGEALGAETLERAHEVAAAHRENIIAAWRAGVPLAAGTDMGSPFTGPEALHDEIAQLAGLGMTAHEAIQAATLEGARVLGLEDELGTVRPGRRADLLVLDGDPLADLGATRRIRHLLQDGELRIRDGAPVVG